MNDSTAPLRPVTLIAPLVAGIMAALVNFGGTFVIIVQAAEAAKLNSSQLASWVWAVSLGIGITGILLSCRYKEPIVTAWSTPGVAFLATVLPVISFPEAIAAYIVSGIGFILLGLSGAFERIVRFIPKGIAAGLLAGILFQFGVGAFQSINVDPVLAGLLIFVFALLRRYTARYAVFGVLLIGAGIVLIRGQVNLSEIDFTLARPVFTKPEFTLTSLFSVALPLFVITLTGQYMPGMLILRNDGYTTSANPILSITGAGSVLMSFFGSHPFNIAAISAAICTGPEAHEDPKKRYIASVISGVIYLLVGLFGVTLASLFMALPKAFTVTMAGLALISAIGGSLANAVSDPVTRETSLVTFLATAANIQFLGLGGALWGLVIGLVVHFVIHFRFQPEVSTNSAQ
jgi:benzoate membrane transport protein